MFSSKFISVATVLVCCVPGVEADHPDNLVSGRAPTTCAGMTLGKTTARESKRRHGKPYKQTRTAEQGFADRGTADYEWQESGTQVIAAAHYVGANEAAFYSIEITSKSAVARTVCVLPLGSELSFAKRRFGRAFSVTARKKDGTVSSFGVEWRDGTTLGGTFDEQNKLIYIHLMSPVE
jgi:hypothetical protein